MAKGYTVSGPNASQAAPATAVTIIGATTVRARLYDIVIGSSATPADNACLMAVTRFTAAGTAGSNPAVQQLDGGDVAGICTAGITHSAEPTYAANVDHLQIGMNQRATFRWVAAPGSEILSVATAANGLGVRVKTSSATLVMNVTVMWVE